MMKAFAIAVQESKVQAWKTWIAECMGPRREAFERFNERMGLTLHRAWLMQSHQGPLAVVVLDGPGADDFLAKLATSREPFDRWFRERVSEFHGIDFSHANVLPPTEMLLDWQTPRFAQIEA